MGKNPQKNGIKSLAGTLTIEICRSCFIRISCRWVFNRCQMKQNHANFPYYLLEMNKINHLNSLFRNCNANLIQHFSAATFDKKLLRIDLIYRYLLSIAVSQFTPGSERKDVNTSKRFKFSDTVLNFQVSKNIK